MNGNDPETVFTITGMSTDELAAHIVRTGRGVRMLMAICQRMGVEASFKSEPPNGLEFVHEHRWARLMGDTFRRCVGCGTTQSMCTICDQPIEGGTVVGDGDGQMKGGGRFAHQDCYEKREANRGQAQSP